MSMMAQRAEVIKKEPEDLDEAPDNDEEEQVQEVSSSEESEESVRIDLISETDGEKKDEETV